MTAAITADFKTAPYLHQLIEFEKSADSKARALLWQMRTGKSKLCIDTACHQFKMGNIDAVVVIAPNGVHENWTRRELPIHHWETIEYNSLTWRTSVAGESGGKNGSKASREIWRESHKTFWAKAKKMMKYKGLAWFSFSSSSVTRPDVRRLISRIVYNRRIFIIFDESHDFRTPGSKRTKMIRALANKCQAKRILSGTSVTNSPLHAWSQYELLEQEALGFKRYKDFKNRYAEYTTETTRQGRNYEKLVSYRNLDELRDKMAPWSSVVLRSDCNDLPDLIRRTRSISINDEQVRVYRELRDQFLLEIGDDRISIGENSIRLAKLQQVLSGFIIDEYGDLYDIPGINPRLEAVSDEVYLSPGKVIVWCRFRHDMDLVSERLMADGHKVVQYHGRISDTEKARVRRLFEPGAENDIKVLVGYPTVGLDLSAASEIIWYSHTFDAIMREQADERATAIGGRNVSLVEITAGGVDDYILDNVTEKISVAEALAGEGLKKVLRRIKI